MNFAGRNIALAWLVAGISVLVIIAVIDRVNRSILMERFQGVDRLFLGSSLLAYALPDLVVPRSLPEVDGKQALRIGLISATEYDLLKVVAVAVDAGVEKVFIEINPIISKQASQPSDCSFIEKINASFKGVKFIITSLLLGKELLPGMWLALKTGIRPLEFEEVLKTYPLRLGTTCEFDRWKSIFQSKQTDFFLIMMPRDAAVMQSFVGQSIKSLEAKAIEFSSRFKVPLFVPDANGDWESKLFLDHAHLSSAGSRKFMKNLDLWWAEYQ